MEAFCFRDMYEKWKSKDILKYRDEWIEDWKKYPPQGYKNFSTDEKLDFHNGVQNNFIPTVIEHGEGHHYVFFPTDKDHFDMLLDLRKHPEQFTLEHMPKLLALIDDDCYELSWQKMLAEMVYEVILHYKEKGLACYFQCLPQLLSNGCFHGCELVMEWLMGSESGKNLIRSVLPGYDPSCKAQLQELLNLEVKDSSLKKALQEIMN